MNKSIVPKHWPETWAIAISSPEHSKEVQKQLFAMGIVWNSGTKECQLCNNTGYLYAVFGCCWRFKIGSRIPSGYTLVNPLKPMKKYKDE